MEKKPELQLLTFECRLNQPFEKVAGGFDVELFRALCPAFPRIRIRRFDGIREGDLVQLEMNFLLFTWQWNGRVESYRYSEDELCFVDSGQKLPPFLAFWRHEHRVNRNADGCTITDAIEFLPGKAWPEFLVRQMIRMQMKPRKEIYRNYFGKMV